VTDRNEYLRQDGSVYPLPMAFYLKLGFEIQPGHRLELPFMSAVRIRYCR